MAITKGFINFNKEILSGEIGAIAGAQMAGLITRNFELSEKMISSLSVIGAIVGAGIFYLIARILNHRKRDDFNVKKLSKDIAYYTSGAIIITVLIYYPSMYFINKKFLHYIKDVNLSTLIAQTIAFILFVLFINIYRYILKIRFKKEIWNHKKAPQFNILQGFWNILQYFTFQ